MTGELIFWLAVLIVMIIAELATAQLVTIWFAAGALGATIAAAFNAPLWVQIVLFLVFSMALLIFTRPILTSTIKKMHPTNLELDLGKKAIVIQDIDNEQLKGRVKINGVDWMARSTDGSIISEGKTVIIDRINGAKMDVSLEENEEK